MSDTENQMGLFEAAPAPVRHHAGATQAQHTASKREEESSAPLAPPPKAAPAEKSATARRKAFPHAKEACKGISGLVPKGDVRLTANIRQDLHLKLKIASAYRRTTIGEIIEELVEKYL